MEFESSVLRRQGELSRTPLLLVLAAAATFRLVWVLCVPYYRFSDPGAYDLLATNLYRFGEYAYVRGEPTTFIPPGTAFIYAALYAMGLGSRFFIHVGNIAMGVGLTWITVVTAQYFGFRRAALAAGALVAVWPTLVAFSSLPNSDIPFTLLAFGGWLLVAKEDSMRRLVFAGALVGFAVLVRATAIVMPLALALAVGMREHSWRKGLRAFAVVSLTAACLVLPWTIRNAVQFHAFVPVASQTYYNVWKGQNPSGEYTDNEPPLPPGLTELERERALAALVHELIAKDPALYVQRIARRIFRLHTHESVGLYWNRVSLGIDDSPNLHQFLRFLFSGFWLIALASALPLVLLHLRGEPSRIVSQFPFLLWLWLCVMHGLTISGDRYHLPIIPLVAVFAAEGLRRGYGKLRRTARTRLTRSGRRESRTRYRPSALSP